MKTQCQLSSLHLFFSFSLGSLGPESERKNCYSSRSNWNPANTHWRFPQFKQRSIASFIDFHFTVCRHPIFPIGIRQIAISLNSQIRRVLAARAQAFFDILPRQFVLNAFNVVAKEYEVL
jgi:hypothetical protein